MSFLRTRRSKIITAGGTLAGLVAVVAAVAYFTTNGSGTGSASVGSSTAVTVTQTGGAITGLVPGVAAKPVTYSIDNPAGNGNQNLGKVTVSNITVDAGHSAACDAATNFQATAPSSAVGTINDGATYTSTSSTQPTVQMLETGSSQDGCKGATLTLTLTAGQGS